MKATMFTSLFVSEKKLYRLPPGKNMLYYILSFKVSRRKKENYQMETEV